MSSATVLPQLLLGIGRLGYRGPIRERALSSLLAWAEEYGVAEVLRWIAEDPGYLVAPAWQFPMSWHMAAFLSARAGAHRNVNQRKEELKEVEHCQRRCRS